MALLLSACATPELAPVPVASITAPAQRTACRPRDDVLSILAAKYGEVPVAVGVTSKGALVEVLTSGDGNTWSIIVSMSNGTSCLVAEGEGWRNLERAETGQRM